MDQTIIQFVTENYLSLTLAFTLLKGSQKSLHGLGMTLLSLSFSGYSKVSGKTTKPPLNRKIHGRV